MRLFGGCAAPDRAPGNSRPDMRSLRGPKPLRVSIQVTTLYYVHDPMCSWCYASAPAWQRIETELPAEISVHYVLGGLAPDTAEPMPLPMREHIRQTWRRIQSVVPGTEFNFDFWTQCTPRRSTYPACRAVLAAKHFDASLERPMIAAIQDAYYREARNPSETAVLGDLAAALGLDRPAFLTYMQSSECRGLLDQDLRTARTLGVAGFPSLVLGTSRGHRLVPHDPRDPRVALTAVADALGGA